MSSVEIPTNLTTLSVENNSSLPPGLPTVNSMSDFSEPHRLNDNEFLEELIRLKALYSNRSAQDRISTPVESQKIPQEIEDRLTFPSSGSISFNQDFRHIESLHMQFGIEKGQRLSHDPVLERARFERAKTDEERQAVRLGVIEDTDRTLYERARSAESTIVYYQDDKGQIYNPDFPGESVDVVLQRGVQYSKNQGFVDYQREAEEFEGWKEIMTVLFDSKTPIGFKAITISEPGKKSGTAFTDNFVDIYTKTIDSSTGQVIVLMTRFASQVSEPEYVKTALRLDKEYFTDGKVIVGEEDIYLKRHPIFINSGADLRDARQLFAEEFRTQKQAIPEEKIKHYLEECRLFTLHYADTICAKFFNPEKVKEAFNATLNLFDSLRRGIAETVTNLANKTVEFSHQVRERIDSWIDQAAGSLRSTQEKIAFLGRMTVEDIMVGCGLSAGFSVDGSNSLSIGSVIRTIGGVISGVFSAISGLFKDKDYCINCGACGALIKCVVRKGQKCPKCPAIREC